MLSVLYKVLLGLLIKNQTPLFKLRCVVSSTITTLPPENISSGYTCVT